MSVWDQEATAPDEQDAEHGSYGVGYRKPPASGKFAKGKSGNPAGRPKKAKAARAVAAAPALEPTRSAILSEHERSVAVREGDKITEIPMREALLRRRNQLGLQGSRLAIREALHDARVEEALVAADKQEDFEFWRDLQQKGREKSAACRARGLPEPDHSVHPDDIVLDYGKQEVSFVGPIGDAGRRCYEYIIRLRDYYFLQADLDHRCPRINDKQKRSSISLLLVQLAEIQLPKRMRRSDHETLNHMVDLNGLTLSELQGRLITEAYCVNDNRSGCATPMTMPTVESMLAVASAKTGPSSKAAAQLKRLTEGITSPHMDMFVGSGSGPLSLSPDEAYARRLGHWRRRRGRQPQMIEFLS